MKFNNIIVVNVLVLSLLVGCQENNDLLEQRCQSIVIDKLLFLSSRTDNYKFEKINVVENCLEVTIRYAGGCGDIVTSMVDSEDIEELPQLTRHLSLDLEDNDPCEALITKSVSYDLVEIQVPEAKEIYLDISGWPTPVLYKY